MSIKVYTKKTDVNGYLATATQLLAIKLRE